MTRGSELSLIDEDDVAVDIEIARHPFERLGRHQCPLPATGRAGLAARQLVAVGRWHTSAPAWSTTAMPIQATLLPDTAAALQPGGSGPAPRRSAAPGLPASIAPQLTNLLRRLFDTRR